MPSPTFEQLEIPDLVVAEADAAALAELAAKHRREFTRLRTLHVARLTGTQPVFHRDRMTQAQLQQLPPVTDHNGVELVAGQRVKCPDGVYARVERVDRRSRRCVVDRADGTKKMTVARRLTAVGKILAAAA